MQRIAGIFEHPDAPDSYNCFTQHFHTFASEFGAVERDTADVTAGPGGARHQTAAQRIGRGRHNNGNSRGLPLRRERRWRANHHDDVGIKPHEFRR
jgi:hypothetical protein